MPSTYNGIGTHYYGNRNAESRTGVCQSCGRSVGLKSYNTRLWFVVFFVPIIPLGRKRIIDQCPSCSRHYVYDLDKWETAKQLSISGAMDAYHASPTPEAAIDVHRQLLAFHEVAQADEIGRVMTEKYHDQAKVQAYLADAMMHLGRIQEAQAHYTRAYELRPDLPEPRIGLARRRVLEGKLNEARQLLDFLEKPGAAQLYSLGPLEHLANAYQAARRHEEALHLYRILLEELPPIAQIKSFRKTVQRSEKALGRKETVLPRKEFSLKGIFSGSRPRGGTSLLRKFAVGAAIIVLICAGFAIGNEYIRRHRHVYIVNATGKPANVELTGQPTLQSGGALQELTLPEGEYHVAIRGAAPEEFLLKIGSDYFDRWAGDPIWVINVGGAAVLVEQQVTYARNPPPAEVTWATGNTLEYFPKVTHPFQNLPESLQMKSHEQRVLTSLNVFRGPMSGAVFSLSAKGQAAKALKVAEEHLPRTPQDELLVQAYLDAASAQNELSRAESFLRKGLNLRPLAMQWHRAYQSLAMAAGREDSLANEYDMMVKAEPSAELHYLRGRASGSPAEAESFFARARELNPSLPQAYFASAYSAMSRADWVAALPLAEKAAALKPKDDHYFESLCEVKLALGRFAEVESEAQARLKRLPADVAGGRMLCEAYLAQNRNKEAEAFVGSYARSGETEEFATYLRRYYLYASGDFARLQKDARMDRSNMGRNTLAWALLEQGEIEQACRVCPLDEKAMSDPYYCLAISLAAKLAGQTSTEQHALQRGLELLKRSGSGAGQAAKLFQTEAPLNMAEIESIELPARGKSLILALAATRHSDQRELLAGAARRLNVSRAFPYHLIQQATKPVPSPDIVP